MFKEKRMNNPVALSRISFCLNFCLIVTFYAYALLLQALPNLLVNPWSWLLGSDWVTSNALLASFFYVYAPAQIIAGIFYDRFNNKYILLLGILLCAVSASLCAMATSFTVALISRMLLGLGAALATIGLLVFSSHHLPQYRFATYASILPIFYACSAVLSFYPCNVVLTIAHWQRVFLLLSLFGLLIAVLAIAYIKDDVCQNKLPLITHLTTVIQKGVNWIAIVYSFAIWMPITIFSGLWGIPYLQTRYGITQAIASLGVAIIWLGLALGTPLIAHLSDRLRHRKGLLMACAALGLATMLTILFDEYLSLFAMYSLLFFLGMAAAGQNLTFALMNDANPIAIRGTSFGLNSLAVLFGGALFPALLGILLQWHWTGPLQQNLPVYSTLIYQRALLVLLPCYGIALLVSALLAQEHNQAYEVS